jgi:nitrite reductase/ring-hydroxylating ferredoxin subunit
MRRSTSVEPDRLVKTHCCFCGQQCGIQLKVRENEVLGFEPWEDFPFNRGMLCPKGVKRYLQGDWPQDHYVERRDFMKFVVLTSGAFAVGQLWIAAQNWWRKRRGRGGVRRISSLDEVAVGASIVFTYPGDHDPCVLTRPGERDFVAYSQKCTHLPCAVIPQPARGALTCSCHDGLFDLRSGRPIAGPPRRPLPRVLLDVRGRDIYATDIEPRTG